MKRFWLPALCVTCCLLYADEGGAKLQERLGDVGLVGEWHYDDLKAAEAAATKSGKPLMIVFRCVP